MKRPSIKIKGKMSAKKGGGAKAKKATAPKLNKKQISGGVYKQQP